METLIHDARYAIRAMRGSPGFTAVAVIVLALGIGANTTIFSLVYALLLRPLPGVEEPQRLVSVFTSDYSSTRYGTSSYPDYLDYRDRNEVFEGLATYREDSMVLSGSDQPERIRGAAVSGNYFSVLGGKTLVGRILSPEDDKPQASEPVVVLSYQTWKRRFGSDTGLIGRTVELNGRGFTVVGVAAERFKGANLAAEVELWFPIGMLAQLDPSTSRTLSRRGSRWLRTIGRLKPGATIEQAQSNIDSISEQLAEAYPQTNRGTLQQPDKPRPMTLVAASEVATLNPNARATTKLMSNLLVGVVGFVLLIACANVANLLLARAESRRKEVAVRLALGAPRARLIRQLLTESTLLAIMGGAVGLLISGWMSELILNFDLPEALDPRLDASVLLFALAVSLLTGLLFGLAPAIQASRVDLVSGLKQTVNSDGRFRRFNLRNALVVFQVGISLPLLIGSGLFLRSLQSAYSADLGFETRNAMLGSVDLRLQHYTPAKEREFAEQVQERVAGLPGVQSVGLTAFLPISNSGMRGGVNIEGYQAQPGEDTELDLNIVGPGYFQTMGIALTRGRDFTEQDNESAQPVAIINEAMAQRYWPDQDPTGKRIGLNGPKGPFTVIVGTVRTGKYSSLTEAPLPYIYLPLAQNFASSLTIIARTTANPSRLVGALRKEILGVDKNLAVFDIRTLNDHIAEALSRERMIATLLGVFGLLALLLASVGMYGVMSYTVTRRTREIGVRMALGAEPGVILRMVAGQAMVLITIGIGVGLVAALALTRIATGLLFGVSATDPATFVLISGILAGVALVACFVPVRRAVKVDPMVALRYE